jgi:hypothetical protein
MDVRLQLLARHLEYKSAKPPITWAVAMRIVQSRARVDNVIKAKACIMCSLLFDCGNAPLRRMSRQWPPYPEVLTAYQLEIDRIKRGVAG